MGRQCGLFWVFHGLSISSICDCLFWEKIANKNENIVLVRGKGLFCAMVIKPKNGKNAWDVCIALKENGLLAKPTHNDIIRFSPPLIITESQLKECIEIIGKTLMEY